MFWKLERRSLQCHLWLSKNKSLKQRKDKLLQTVCLPTKCYLYVFLLGLYVNVKSTQLTSEYCIFYWTVYCILYIVIHSSPVQSSTIQLITAVLIRECSLPTVELIVYWPFHPTDVSSCSLHYTCKLSSYKPPKAAHRSNSYLWNHS